MFGFFLGGMLLLSAFSTSNLPPFLLGPLCCAEWRRTFCAKSSNFSNWKATILLYMLVQCLWGQTNIQVCHLEMAQWFAIGTAQNLICVCRVLLCGCEEEHPPLHQRRCLDLVLTSYNCQSLSRAFQVPSSHLPLLLHRPLRHRQCESKCNVFWLPWNSHQQARLERPNPLARPQLNQASHCFCLLFIRVRLTRRMSTARFHIAAGVAHVEKLSGCASVIFVKTDFHCGILDTARFTQSYVLIHILSRRIQVMKSWLLAVDMVEAGQIFNDLTP